MEPLFVPRPGKDLDEGDGWVVALVHDARYEDSDFGGRGTEIVIIDAKKFSEGPVARLRLPKYVPYGVHGRGRQNTSLVRRKRTSWRVWRS